MNVVANSDSTAAATDAAIGWVLRRSSGRHEAGDEAAFVAWLDAHPDHRAAWSRVAGVLATPVTQLRQMGERRPGAAAAARRALLAAPDSRQRRRLLQGGVAMIVLGTGATLAVDRRAGPWDRVTADLRAGTGERLARTLADGSSLMLNAGSVVDLQFSPSERRVRLLAGALLAQAAPDAQRPFVVETVHGSVRALGTRFVVQQRRDDSYAMVQEHAVQVRTRGGAIQHLAEGESVRFTRVGVDTVQTGEAHRAAWTRGALDVRNDSLDEVIDALRPYLPGPVRVSPAAARLRVFGVFRLDEPQRVLQALAETQPIAVRRYAGWLTLVETR